jgi:hypothetical protein
VGQDVLGRADRREQVAEHAVGQARVVEEQPTALHAGITSRLDELARTLGTSHLRQLLSVSAAAIWLGSPTLVRRFTRFAYSTTV